MTIQWFPGHMAKTRRLIAENLKSVDAVCQVLDARIPLSSQNSDLDAICAHKPRLYILTRADLADPAVTAAWLKHFEIPAIAVDAKRGSCADTFASLLKSVPNRRGLPKLMVVGIPNAGKSTFINRIAGRNAAKAENRPGVTRGKQWIDAGNCLLLDMPGTLAPKLDDQELALNVAFTGAIRDQILDTEELAFLLIGRLGDNPQFRDRCKGGTLEEIARARGLLARGGEPDTERAATLIIDEFRNGKFGRISLENPSDFPKITDNN